MHIARGRAFTLHGRLNAPIYASSHTQVISHQGGAICRGLCVALSSTKESDRPDSAVQLKIRLKSRAFSSPANRNRIRAGRSHASSFSPNISLIASSQRKREREREREERDAARSVSTSIRQGRTFFWIKATHTQPKSQRVTSFNPDFQVDLIDALINGRSEHTAGQATTLTGLTRQLFHLFPGVRVLASRLERIKGRHRWPGWAAISHPRKSPLTRSSPTGVVLPA